MVTGPFVPRRRFARGRQLMVRGAGPGATAEVHGGLRACAGVDEGEAGGQGGAVDVRVAAAAVDDLHALPPLRLVPVSHVYSAGTAVGTLGFFVCHGLPTPARALASSFLWSMLDWRAIMIRWACGEPAPCMLSVR